MVAVARDPPSTNVLEESDVFWNAVDTNPNTNAHTGFVIEPQL